MKIDILIQKNSFPIKWFISPKSWSACTRNFRVRTLKSTVMSLGGAGKCVLKNSVYSIPCQQREHYFPCRVLKCYINICNCKTEPRSESEYNKTSSRNGSNWHRYCVWY